MTGVLAGGRALVATLIGVGLMAASMAWMVILLVVR